MNRVLKSCRQTLSPMLIDNSFLIEIDHTGRGYWRTLCSQCLSMTLTREGFYRTKSPPWCFSVPCWDFVVLNPAWYNCEGDTNFRSSLGLGWYYQTGVELVYCLFLKINNNLYYWLDLSTKIITCFCWVINNKDGGFNVVTHRDGSFWFGS